MFTIKFHFMARQIGTLKVQGTVDNITFAQTPDGSIVKRKTSITRRKIMNNNAFTRTRETMAEFSTAAAAGKLLRDSVSTLLQDAKDSKVASRLLQAMMAVIKADSTSARGSRKVTTGNPGLLEGFNFNIKSNLHSIITVPHTVTVTRNTGELGVSFGTFIPSISLQAPAGTTHFKIVSAGVDINFEDGTYTSDQEESAVLAYDNTPTGAIDLKNTVTPNSQNPLFLLLGIRFYSEVNGVQYPLKDAVYNGLTILKVSEV
jgi:hypothetical protein